MPHIVYEVWLTIVCLIVLTVVSEGITGLLNAVRKFAGYAPTTYQEWRTVTRSKKGFITYSIYIVLALILIWRWSPSDNFIGSVVLGVTYGISLAIAEQTVMIWLRHRRKPVEVEIPLDDRL